MKSKSVLGYSKGSPYRNNSYIDINTPEGLIDMSNTDIPLYAVDETGMGKMLMPYSGMHRFRGKKVREIPMQKGGLHKGDRMFQNWYNKNTREGLNGIASSDPAQSFDYKMYYNDMMQGKTGYVNPNSDDHYLDTYKYPTHPSFSVESRYFTNIAEMPNALSYDGDFRKKVNYDDTPLGRKYQRGGISREDAMAFLFDDDEPAKPKAQENTAPSEAEIALQQERESFESEKRAFASEQEYQTALALGMQPFAERRSRRGTSSGSTGNPYSAKPVDVNANAKLAFDHYTNKGLKPHIAAGIVGNLMHESGLNPGVTGDGGKARGIAQWHPDRFSKLTAWANQNNRNPFSLEAQLDFVLEEPGEGPRAMRQLEGAQNSGQAAAIFSNTYERPGIPALDKRMGYARSLHPYKQGGTTINPYKYF